MEKRMRWVTETQLDKLIYHILYHQDLSVEEMVETQEREPRNHSRGFL